MGYSFQWLQGQELFDHHMGRYSQIRTDQQENRRSLVWQETTTQRPATGQSQGTYGWEKGTGNKVLAEWKTPWCLDKHAFQPRTLIVSVAVTL